METANTWSGSGQGGDWEEVAFAWQGGQCFIEYDFYPRLAHRISVCLIELIQQLSVPYALLSGCSVTGHYNITLYCHQYPACSKHRRAHMPRPGLTLSKSATSSSTRSLSILDMQAIAICRKRRARNSLSSCLCEHGPLLNSMAARSRYFVLDESP